MPVRPPLEEKGGKVTRVTLARVKVPEKVGPRSSFVIGTWKVLVQRQRMNALSTTEKVRPKRLKKRLRGMRKGRPTPHRRPTPRFAQIGKLRVNVHWAMPASSRIPRRGGARENVPVDKQAATVTPRLPPSPSNSTSYRPKKMCAMSGSMDYPRRYAQCRWNALPVFGSLANIVLVARRWVVLAVNTFLLGFLGP